MALQKISQSATVVRLVEKNFKELHNNCPANISEAVERGESMVMVEKVAGKESLVRAIEFELIQMTSMLNMNPSLLLQKHQIPVVAEGLFDNFKTESIEDFQLAFKRGAMGFYNPEGLFRVDGAVVTQWIRSYLEEKYSHIEQQHNKRKTERETEETAIDYAAYVARIQKEGTPEERQRKKELETNKESNDYERFKLERIRPKFLCDGILIQAVDESYARKAYKESTGKEAESVEKI